LICFFRCIVRTVPTIFSPASPVHRRGFVVAQIGSDYYVGSNGNHRTIVSKAVGVDEIFAEVTVIPVQKDS